MASSKVKLVQPPLPGDEIVITGMSGAFPASANVDEFRDNLYNKQTMVTEMYRWDPKDFPDIPNKGGQIGDLSRFDANFFGVHYKQVHAMDPQGRIIMEKAYEAVIDAGINPNTLRNSKTGVYIGACFSETEKVWFYNKVQMDGFGLTGCSRAMLANRVSYSMGFTGPSYVVDTACSSSGYAMEHAYKAIHSGEIDNAIVGGCNLLLHPLVMQQFVNLGVLSPDCQCKSFDEYANGYARAETICAILLQRAKNAKRVYAQVCHAKTNCDGFKPEGITYPSSELQTKLLQDFYKEIAFDPKKVGFVEFHGTGTKVGDPQEVTAVETVFCNGRKQPLLIGSVKSNIGHGEPASGVSSIIKVCFQLYYGRIAPNINYKTPRLDLTPIIENRMKVVTEAIPFDGEWAAVNNFGFGGANAHILMKRFTNRQKINSGKPKDSLPRLVCVSGRTKEAVSHLLEHLQSIQPLDAEYVGLFHNIYNENIAGHVFRGYTILNTDETEEKRKVQEVTHYAELKRPIWFLYSGMGSQWPSMAKSLMSLPLFAESIKRSADVLKPKGIDLYDILLNEDPKVFDKILNAFVGIAAVQLALTNILFAMGIKPNHIIGHSVGELGCAYADGCFTQDQMVLSAYARGLASEQTPVIKGAMAAVGLGYDKIKSLCPPDIEVACRNSAVSCTISGPYDSVQSFVAELKSKDIFARAVNTANIAYHSRYIKEMGPKLLKALRVDVPKPKPRSSRWISTSIPESQWNSDLAKYSSAEYHTNNLLSPVLFEESAKHIHSNAIVIEIAPHGLLQAIVKRSLPTTVSNFSLTQRGLDNRHVLLTTLGKLYNEGVTCNLSALYPKVEFPVSAGTPAISPHIKWEHSEERFVYRHEISTNVKSSERVVDYSFKDEAQRYIAGHVIDDRNLVPATAYIHMIWESLCYMYNFKEFGSPVVFEDVRFLRATSMPKQSNISVFFTTVIQIGSGVFEITESNSTVVTGRVSIPEDVELEKTKGVEYEETKTTEDVPLRSKDFYKELRLRGYNYKGMFRSVQECSINGKSSKISWNNNWVAFMDCMLQMKIINVDSRALYVPTSIQKMVIDPRQHLQLAEKLDAENPIFDCYYNPYLDVIQAGGIEIREVRATPINRRKHIADPVLETYDFIPYHVTTKYSVDAALRICAQLALENQPHLKVKIVEQSYESKVLLSIKLAEVLGELPLIQTETIILSKDEIENLPENIKVENDKLSQQSNVSFIIDNNLMTNNNQLTTALSVLREGGFIISREQTLDKTNKHVVATIPLDDEYLVVIDQRKEDPIQSVIEITNQSLDHFNWLNPLKESIKNSQNTVLYAQGELTNGIIGLTNCLRKEPGGENFRCVFIIDDSAPKFNVDLPFYNGQLSKNLAVNVYKNGTWGSFRHLKFEPVETVTTSHSYVDLKTRGDLTTLSWHSGPLIDDNQKNLTEVYYSALNFRDIMVATGKISNDIVSKASFDPTCDQGLEFSGRARSGHRVMGMVSAGALGTRVVTDEKFTWKIPDSWSLEDAATVPVVYATAYYALVTVGEMKEGMKVLIHAGTGGVGQAAINLALFYGCTVYTTVGTQEKREFIKRTYPQITDEYIGNSRDTTFEAMIRSHTKGQGVDLVLNSLAEEKLQASLRCLGAGGKFLEIGKFDLSRNSSLGMEMFLKRTSFHGIVLDKFFTEDHPHKQKLHQEIHEHILNGAIKPLPRTIFKNDEVEKAYRFMAQGKHLGKVLIEVRKEEGTKITSPRTVSIPAHPRFFCDPTKSYVVVGGLGGFGLELINWLVSRGARKIVACSRTGISNGYQAMKVKLWREKNVTTVISTANLTTEEGVTSVLHKASLLGEVDGIFNLAVVLRDALLEDQTQESFRTSLHCKALVTRHLDQLSRKMCPRLRHFVVFSSVSCGRGNIGQSNYGMANSIMERICEHRKCEKLPALAIQWGAVGDVGLVADMQDNDKILEIGGTLQQRINDCLDVLDAFVNNTKPAVVASMVVAEKKQGVAGNVVECVANIMSIKDVQSISLQSTLAELGMDSMMAVEIKQTLEREYDIILTPKELRTLTFAKLVDLSSTKKITTQVKEENIVRLINMFPSEESSQHVLVELPTRSPGKPNSPPIFFIPGIDGMSLMFNNLCSKLDRKALCLQLVPSNAYFTVEEIATSLLPAIKSNLKSNEPLNIVAHSYGSCVALEVCMQLEKEGYKANLVCVDGSPQTLQMMVKARTNGTQEPALIETFILHCLYEFFIQGEYKEFTDEISALGSWDERKSRFQEKIDAATTKASIYSMEYRQNVCDSFLKRFISLINYNVTSKLHTLKWTQMKLVKPESSFMGSTSQNDDFELSKFLESGIVEIVNMQGDHISVLYNENLSAFIQKVYE